MKKKEQAKSQEIEKEEPKIISPEEFDSVMKNILSHPPIEKKKRTKKEAKN